MHREKVEDIQGLIAAQQHSYLAPATQQHWHFPEWLYAVYWGPSKSTPCENVNHITAAISLTLLTLNASSGSNANKPRYTGTWTAERWTFVKYIPTAKALLQSTVINYGYLYRLGDIDVIQPNRNGPLGLYAYILDTNVCQLLSSIDIRRNSHIFSMCWRRTERKSHQISCIGQSRTQTEDKPSDK